MHYALSLIWCPDVRMNEPSLVSTALFIRVACNIFFYNQQMAQLSDTSTSCQHNVDAVRGTCHSPRGVIRDVWHWDSDACFISAEACRLTVPGLMSDLCNHMTDDAEASLWNTRGDVTDSNIWCCFIFREMWNDQCSLPASLATTLAMSP